MKTSEFKKYFEDEGYYVSDLSNGLRFENEDSFLLFINTKLNVLNTSFLGFEALPLHKKQEYYKIICDYLTTPPEEREDEKRYYLRLKGIFGGGIYLCAYDFWSEWGLIDKGSLTHSDEYYFKFTQEDIDNLPKVIKSHNWEYVEVDDHD